MTTLVFADDVFSRLSEACTASATTLYINNEDAGQFTTSASDGKIMAVIVNQFAYREVIAITNVNVVTGALTVLRGQESTIARAWPVGAIVSLRLTAGVLETFLQKGE